MTSALVGLITGLVGIVAAVVQWWVANDPRLRHARAVAYATQLQDDLAAALVAEDADGVAAANARLRELQLASASRLPAR